MGVGCGSNKNFLLFLHLTLYSIVLLPLSFIILCIRLIGPYYRWSCWGYALGTLLLRSMPVRCTDFRGPYEGLILGLAGVACAMLGAAAIRSHWNAWDDYHIDLKTNTFYLSFHFLTFFLIVFLFFYISLFKL